MPAASGNLAVRLMDAMEVTGAQDLAVPSSSPQKPYVPDILVDDLPYNVGRPFCSRYWSGCLAWNARSSWCNPRWPIGSPPDLVRARTACRRSRRTMVRGTVIHGSRWLGASFGRLGTWIPLSFRSLAIPSSPRLLERMFSR